jgi:hypothetical protein
VFYSVIETRDFLLFNESAQGLLNGYFIKLKVKLLFTSVSVPIYMNCIVK